MGISAGTRSVPSATNLTPIVSNKAFLETVFGPIWETALISGFPGDPEDKDNVYWAAYVARMLPGDARERELNTYFCPSLMRRSRRWGSAFVSFHVIVVDDYGTEKVPAGKPEQILGRRPNYLIRTSPDSYQAGWLTGPLTELDYVKAMLGALKARLGGGDNLTDPIAWRRLPVGINGKARHQGEDGTQWQVTGGWL